MEIITAPLPLFDSIQEIEHHTVDPRYYPHFHQKDFEMALGFLRSYRGSQGTFNAYRREVERLLHWSWSIAKQELTALRRENIENYLRFCQQPPTSWIGTNKPPRFILEQGLRVPNPEWRPFVATVSKAEHRRGERPIVANFELSDSAIKEVFAILSSFFNYLIQEEYAVMNPVALIRQKSQFIRSKQQAPRIRRLSELQWQYVITTAKALAEENPNTHERTLFIMSCLYAMYLRISELASTERWQPTMNDFSQDSDHNWWFTTVSKGNKQRSIAVSDSMLDCLRRWRQHLGLSRLPTPADNSPLLPKLTGRGGIQSINVIRRIVQFCFDKTIDQLHQDNFHEDAEALLEATVHWLRHTGISDDVKHRPREHVRDDAGHSSSATTDRYIDVEMRERHRSAKQKLIVEE
jgi:site-specific recombinase XerD